LEWFVPNQELDLDDKTPPGRMSMNSALKAIAIKCEAELTERSALYPSPRCERFIREILRTAEEALTHG
jgi:hypothetical protein